MADEALRQFADNPKATAAQVYDLVHGVAGIVLDAKVANLLKVVIENGRLQVAINTHGGTGLWHEPDGFYYDRIHLGGKATPMRLRSAVGLIPLIGTIVLFVFLVSGGTRGPNRFGPDPIEVGKGERHDL